MIPLSGNNHIIERAHLEPQLCPGIKVRFRIDRSADALVLSHAPVLIEGRGAVDRWLVGS